MKAVTPAAVGALATLFAKNASLIQHENFMLNPKALQDAENALRETNSGLKDQDIHVALAHACLRQKTYQTLTKFSHVATKDEMEEALVHTELPKDLQAELLQLNPRPVGIEPPNTWKDELEYLQKLSESQSNPNDWLWRQLLNHPITAYNPVQCPKCRHVVPDAYSPSVSQGEADSKVGLVEIEPVGNELGLRSGWFRGPRGKVVFQITCTECQQVYTWYRSGHPNILLSPHKQGRLCGEQENLRLSLANCLGIPLRMAVPLDWDHVWTEFCCAFSFSNSENNKWQVEDDSARNFACRLDEGIGVWTGVLALHPDPALCEDATDLYLRSQQDGGRTDNEHSEKLADYRSRVNHARSDSSFAKTQAGTGAGYIIHRVQLSSNEVTDTIKQAARDFKREKKWWDLTSA